MPSGTGLTPVSQIGVPTASKARQIVCWPQLSPLVRFCTLGSKRLGGKEVKNMFTVKPGAL